MVSRKDGCFLSSLIFFTLVFGVFLGAQETGPVYDEGNFFIEWNDGGPRFIQRILWNPVELALRYEISLEEEQAGKYEKLLRESTRENFLNVSLRPGRYRYQVGVYNLLNRLEHTSDWVSFEVLNALQPKITGFTPEEFFLDTGEEWQLTVTGEDMDAGADIMLQSGDGDGIRPLRIEVEGNTARLVFDKGQLVPGSYDVYIRNPGGLEDSAGTFMVYLQAPHGPFGRPDIIVSAGYAPFIPLYGILFAEDAFEGHFYPLGFALRGGVLPLKRSWGSLGAELGVSWNMLYEQKKSYTVAAHIMAFHLNVLYQLWLPNQPMALNFRLGIGINALLDFYYDTGNGKKDSLSSGYLSLDTEVSFLWHVKGPLFAEAGVDFTHIISATNPAQMGYLRPVLGVLWQF